MAQRVRQVRLNIYGCLVCKFKSKCWPNKLINQIYAISTINLVTDVFQQKMPQVASTIPK